MTDDNQNQAEPVKTYRPWVGVVLSFFITGISQFLAGKRLVGVGWLVSIVFLEFVGFVCLASPLMPGDLFGFVLFAVAFGLWIIMLFHSYQPIPKLRWIGWFSPSSAVGKDATLICKGLGILNPRFRHYIFNDFLNDPALLG
ncbi:MAG: hypothetical protein WBW41_13995 [Verrucomicrobiia bacterium]